MLSRVKIYQYHDTVLNQVSRHNLELLYPALYRDKCVSYSHLLVTVS